VLVHLSVNVAARDCTDDIKGMPSALDAIGDTDHIKGNPYNT
jgi:hypothetical protein